MIARFFWLASYPKSGNTWLRLFLTSLAQGGGPVDINDAVGKPTTAALRPLFDTLLDVDSSDLLVDEIELARPEFYRRWAASLAVPTALKVHDAWTLTAAGEPIFPPETTLATFYIVRDPRDVAVSLADHFALPIDDVIGRMANSDTVSGQVDDGAIQRQLRQKLGSWSEHVRSWLHSGLSITLLRFEDMVANPRETLTAAAKSFDPSVSEETIARALEATRFETLREQEERSGFGERVAHRRGFFRSGRSGGWPEVLTSAQAARIENDHRTTMEFLGYL